MRNLEHIKILSRGVLAEDPLSLQSLSQRSYFLIDRDDATQWFMGLGEIGRFYTEDPRNMAAKEVSQSSSSDSNPYVGREFWRTDNYSPIAICPTPRSAIHHDPEICSAVKPGTHLKIVRTGTSPEPYSDGSLFDKYYIVQRDDNTYGYVKLADVGSPELDRRMPDSDAPSLYGIAWEDPKITAAKLKTAEAAAKAECKRRGSVRLGMSEAQVLASCFGSPTGKITTITAHAVRDKWVYGDEGALLYFDNGKLVRIRMTQ